MRTGAAGAVAIAAVMAVAAPAHAYEFAVRARMLAQAYELRSMRLLGPDLVLGRRRVAQALSLDIWNIGDDDRDRDGDHRRRHGPRVSFTGYLRLEHDFGDWTLGSLDRGSGRTIDALDLVPELASSSLAVDLLYGYLAVDDLAGRVDLRVGRLLWLDSLDAASLDGASATVRLPGHVAVEAFGGLRVREASPMGNATVELDGTGGADCREYVEGPTPGSGSWRLIDRSRVITNRPLASDFEYCPQRLEPMPTAGAAVEAWGVPGLHARVVYRRSQSRSVGLIGPVDRLDYPDLGLYPDDRGQAPGWGVNEERVAAEARGEIGVAGGRGEIAPWAAARWSLLHGLVDQAAGGVRLRWGDQALEPEVAYARPTFDGDSIFNAFAIAPSTDARVTWERAPRRGRLRAFATGWLRWYHGWGDEPAARAGGVLAGAEAALGAGWIARLDLVHDDGYGGRRSGGAASVRWRARERVSGSGRLTLYDIDGDSGSAVDRRAVLGGAQTAVTYRLGDRAAVHAAIEATADRALPFQVRALGVLDLAFVPEL